VTALEKSKDLDEMKIEELVGSLKTYEYSLPLVKKAKKIALMASKKKARVSSEDDSNNKEDAVAMLAKNFGSLMRNDKFKKKFTERLKKALRESEPEEAEKKDPRGPRCFECSGLGHIWADYENHNRLKGNPTIRLSVMSQKKKSSLLLKIQDLENNLLETQSHSYSWRGSLTRNSLICYEFKRAQLTRLDSGM
jgi:hypothetical protein